MTRPAYGPYHRLQTKVDNQLVEESGIVGGKAPRNIYSGARPKIQAYEGQLPPGRTGIEFYTDVEPDQWLPPGLAEWSQDRAGVLELGADPKDGRDVIGIRVFIEKRVDR